MKILFVNKFFYLHGGVERYFFKLSRLLSLHDHNIAYFSMQNSKNFPSKYSKYFVSNISFQDKSFVNSLKILTRMLYSFEAKKKISSLLDNFPANIAHLRTIYHHLSPSILTELKKRNIPIIQTLGDYHVIAPNYNLFHDGEICEVTKPNKFYRAVFHKCVKNSHLASFACCLEIYLHSLTGLYPKLVDIFISPSKFMKKKLIEYGLDKKKIIYLPHFIDSRGYIPKYQDDGYILYFGRLSEEKGLEFLVNVISDLPKVKLKIVGRGPLKKILDKKINDMKIRNVEMVDFKDGKELRNLINESFFTILPSIWYENSPNSVLETFASGKPVIASDIGGIPELVKDGHTGLLFEPENIEDCQEKILKLWDSRRLCHKLGKNAREYVVKNFGPEKHYEKLMEIYKKAIELRR